MIRIERLRMHLPPGFEHRAVSISRLVGEALAKEHLSQDGVLDAIAVKPQRLPLTSSDGDIASQIAAAIVAAVKGRKA